MSASKSSWIHTTFPLPRPEYAKQPESLLTDLLWNSKGSSLATTPNGGNSYLDELTRLRGEKKNSPTNRLIPLRSRGGKLGTTTETVPIAEQTSLNTMITMSDETQKLTRALLESIFAPQSRGDKAFACVPVRPDSIILQTLQGLVNKDGPPDLARAIEVVGWLGGSNDQGHVAALFLDVFSRRAGVQEGLTGLIDNIFPLIAQHTWATLLIKNGNTTSSLQPWPDVSAMNVKVEDLSVLAGCNKTPFRWFWKKWSALCDPANDWYDKLPERRFIDWATCLLRTGLAFAYLWEADFFCKVHEALVERAKAPSEMCTMSSLRLLTREGTTLAAIESPHLPAVRKHAWSTLSTLIARGYVARKRFEDYLESGHPFPASLGDSIETIVEKWIDSLSTSATLTDLASPLQIEPQTAKNTKEFVRYLLQPRSSDDDSADQADFYYLVRSNSKSLWFQPGPEWLVVVTSLLSTRIGGQCTLGMLLDDLAGLGVRVERWVLVNMLEEAGLSVDSPDADNALLIRSGF